MLECKQGGAAANAHEDAPLRKEGQEQNKKLKTGHGKHGTKGFDTAMLKTHAQAQRYALSDLPLSAPPPAHPVQLAT